MQSLSIDPYNTLWPEWFQKEATLIKEALGENCIFIEHTGSTSVPGLAAKPIIDMIPIVRNILDVDRCSPAMEALGYEIKGECGELFRRYFKKRGYNVHVYEEGHGEIQRHINFRNWLVAHEKDRVFYALLKQDLVKKFPTDIVSYCTGKEEFIFGIDAKAGSHGARLVLALTPSEWETFLRICSQHHVKNFFLDIHSDRTYQSYEHYFHIIMYHNSAIVSIALIDANPMKIPDIKWILSDKENRQRIAEKTMKDLLERWIYERVKFPDPSLRKKI